MSIDYKIGYTHTGAGFVTLASLGIIDPQPIPVQYAEHVPTLDANQRGVGWLQCEWRWAYLLAADVTALRAYCPEPAVSSAVYIKTVKSGGGTAVYSAILWWPQTEPAYRAEAYQDFVLQFVHMVEDITT
jgi:hypothetical protein